METDLYSFVLLYHPSAETASNRRLAIAKKSDGLYFRFDSVRITILCSKHARKGRMHGEKHDAGHDGRQSVETDCGLCAAGPAEPDFPAAV